MVLFACVFFIVAMMGQFSFFDYSSEDVVGFGLPFLDILNDILGNNDLSPSFSPPVNDYPSPDNIIMLMHMDGGATDSKGGNDGSVIGADCSVSGKFGEGCEFGNVGGYIDVDDNGLEPSEITVSTWVKFYSTGDGVDYRIYSHGNDWNDGEGLHLLHFRGTNRLLAQISQGPGNDNVDTRSSFTPQENVWYHIVVTYGSDFVNRLYINGVLEDSATGTGPIYYHSGQNLHIGSGPGSAGAGGVDGVIDEVVVYDKALTAGEISQLYNLEEVSECFEDWSCSSWSVCVDSLQTRTCSDANSCGTELNKPEESQVCVVGCVESWSCEEWSECVNGRQIRECLDANSCGTEISMPEIDEGCGVAEVKNVK